MNVDPSDGLRLAIACTPRSGSTWLRQMLAHVYDLSEDVPLTTVDQEWPRTPDEIDWARIPARAVIHCHFRPDEALLERFDEGGFRVLTIARHPLDVAISTLRFARAWPRVQPPQLDEVVSPAIWTTDRHLWTSPRCTEFMNYATGPLFASLLAITCDWWQLPHVVQVRYEDLKPDPVRGLHRIVNALESPPVRPIEEAVAITTDDEARKAEVPFLTPYGVPRGWKRMFTSEPAFRIADAQAEAFRVLGYVCDPDENLSDDEADLHWYKLDALSAHRFADSQHEWVVALDAALKRSAAEANEHILALEEALRRHQELLADIGPSSLALARRITRLRRKFPFLATAVRPFLRETNKANRADP